MPAQKLTPPRLAVLRAVAAGTLRRSESIGSLYATYMDRKNVTRQINALSQRKLIRIGEYETSPWPNRLWLLTDAGRDELTRYPIPAE